MKKGDIVKLKSGGLPMTVASGGKNGKVTCIWFNGNKELVRAKLDVATLVPDSPPESKSARRG